MYSLFKTSVVGNKFLSMRGRIQSVRRPLCRMFSTLPIVLCGRANIGYAQIAAVSVKVHAEKSSQFDARALRHAGVWRCSVRTVTRRQRSRADAQVGLASSGSSPIRTIVPYSICRAYRPSLL